MFAQEKVEKFLRVKRMQNREIKSELRQSRAYRNPSFLQKMVEHSDIKEFGSNFPAEVFDPDNLHEEVTPLCIYCMQQVKGAAQWALARAESHPNRDPGSIVSRRCQ
jgi:HCNGP-like protein